MEKNSFCIPEDVSVGDWIKASLVPWVLDPGKNYYPVGITIPGGFESYVLVRHKGPGDTFGNLGEQTLTLLVEVLAKFTDTSSHCFMALWEGQGWMHSGSISKFTPEKPLQRRRLKFGRYSLLSFRSSTMRDLDQAEKNLDHLASNTLPHGIMTSARMKLPHRDYLLMCGEIWDATRIGYSFNEHSSTQSPNIMWPEDRAWILASKIDFNATLIAGTHELVEEVLQIEELAAEKFNWSDLIVDLPLI